jgi:peroxisomal 3,2-trans-enoyl-CoA isomerase
MIAETIAAFRELNENPNTVFTVLTGTGRFFSAGADVKSKLQSIFNALKPCTC